MRPLSLAVLVLVLAACGPDEQPPNVVPNADTTGAAVPDADFPDALQSAPEAAPPGDDAPPGEPPAGPAD